MVRIVPDFEVATSSALSWLNTGRFAGTRVIDAAGSTLRLSVYDVSSVAVAAPFITIQDPAGVPQQPWDCAAGTGTRGATVFTESVSLGSSLSVGASKRGTRNIVPITGGTVTGNVKGSVLAGGADFQLMGATTTLDARYALRTSDGELIVVRNCGSMGALVPRFETRTAGAYAYLNTGSYLSSDPGMASGAVTITFYERR